MPADIYFLSSIQFAGNPIPEEVLGIFFQVCMIQVDPIIGEYKLRSFRGIGVLAEAVVVPCVLLSARAIR